MTLEKQEINRIEAAKTAIGTAIAGKGVAVPSGTKLDGMAALIDGIEQGSDPVLQEKTVSPATSAQSVTPDSGYDGLSKVTVNAMPTATQATPSISVSSAGLITASATQTAGYVAAGTKSATKQLTVQAAQTITPGTSNKTIASGRYLTGNQTIKGDANLVAGNIAKDVTIFGVTGTHEGGEDISAETAEYTELLTDLETAVDALPDAGSGGGTLDTGTLVGVSTMADDDDDGSGYIYYYDLEDIPNISSKKLVVLCYGKTYTVVLSRINTTDAFSIKQQWADTSSNVMLNDNILKTNSSSSSVFSSFDYYAV